MPSRGSQTAFLGGADARNPEKRKGSFRGAKRTISRRRRKPLRLLGVRNAAFREIHCFQWLQLPFVSHLRQKLLWPAPMRSPGRGAADF